MLRVFCSNLVKYQATTGHNVWSKRLLASLPNQYFEARKAVLDLKNDPGQAEKLKLYALYKQVEDGPCKLTKPKDNNAESKAKFEAWKALGKLDKEAAQNEYIRQVNILIANEKEGK